MGRGGRGREFEGKGREFREGGKGRQTVRDHRDALRIKAIHHRAQHLELVLHGVRQEIRVHEHGVGRDQGCVVLEEEGGGDLGDGAHELVVCGFGFLGGGGELVGFAVGGKD